MSESTMWIIPEAPPPESVKIEQQRKAKGGLCVGILDNAKSNADHLLGMIAQGIEAQLPVTSIVSFRKEGPAAGADPGVLDALAGQADVVISAMAD
jgi:hypothetical protein